MRLAVAMVLGLFAACATAPMAPPAADVAAKTFPIPPAGISRLYVARPGVAGPSVLLQVTVDGISHGSLSTQSYMVVDVPPGKHIVTTHESAREQNLPIEAENGRIYYFVQAGRKGLHAVPDAEGQDAVRRSKLVAGAVP